MHDYLGKKERIEKDVIHLIQNIFDTICGDNKISASIATSTIEFQRFLNIYNNINNNMNGKADLDQAENVYITGFERELIKRALNTDKDFMEKAFEVAPLHIKEQMVSCLNVKQLLNSEDIVFIDLAIENISDFDNKYKGLDKDLDNAVVILKSEIEKSNDKLKKEKIESILESVSYIKEEIAEKTVIASNKM